MFIDTLHPIFEGRGFRWNDTETNESDAFEYGSTNEGDAAQNWRRTTFFHMLEHGHDELQIDLADCAWLDFSMIDNLAAKGHKHFVAFVHRFGSEDRLDFTVVGPAVNEVSRIASMCSSVDRELLTSSAFRAGLDAAGRGYLVSTGRFALRSIGRAQELYTLDPDIASDEVVAGKYARYLAV